MVSLRREELDERFPGLLDSVLQSAPPVARQLSRAARDSG
jgi:hypothetical protein